MPGLGLHSSWYTRMIYYAEVQDYTGHGLQNYAGIRITQFNSTQARDAVLWIYFVSRLYNRGQICIFSKCS
jgi:hypothetical protein